MSPADFCLPETSLKYASLSSGLVFTTLLQSCQITHTLPESAAYWKRCRPWDCMLMSGTGCLPTFSQDRCVDPCSDGITCFSSSWQLLAMDQRFASMTMHALTLPWVGCILIKWALFMLFTRLWARPIAVSNLGLWTCVLTPKAKSRCMYIQPEVRKQDLQLIYHKNVGSLHVLLGVALDDILMGSYIYIHIYMYICDYLQPLPNNCMRMQSLTHYWCMLHVMKLA